MSEDIHTLSGAYAVDALDDVERARFERHLAGCTACQAEVESLVAAASELSVLTEVSPPASLRAKVLAEIATVRPLPPLAAQQDDPADDVTSTPPAPVQPQATAPAPAAPSEPPSEPPSESPSQSPVEHDDDLAGRRRARSARGLARGWRIVVAAATVVRSNALHKAVIVTSGMSQPPAGKVFQLWLQDATGHMTSAGLMPGGGDQVVVLNGDASHSKGAGITVEPEGGSDQPTSDPVAFIAFA